MPTKNEGATVVPQQLIELAKLVFEAYREAVGGKNVAGGAIPLWDDLGEKVQAGWIAAAAVGYREGYADSENPPMIPLS
jgi:hypothetical protein